MNKLNKKNMSVLLENHIKNNGWVNKNNPCSCSYCVGNHKLHYGLNIPNDWSSWNSWWVIKYGNGKYIRWTHPFLKIFKKK